MTVPMDLYAPFSTGTGADVTEAMWRNFMRNLRDDGVIATRSYPPEDPSELRVSADGTGMSVTVEPGECWIQAHWGETTTSTLLPIASPDPSNPRVDLVVARADFVANLIELDVVTGTPAPTPSAPALARDTSVWEIALAEVSVTVGAVAIVDDDVTDRRHRVGPGVFNEFDPPLYTEFPSPGPTAVDLGSGGQKFCRWYLAGTILHLRYDFRWGTGPFAKPGYGYVYTLLPRELRSATFTGNQWLWTHLWTHDPNASVADRDWGGMAYLAPDSSMVFPHFATSNTDARINPYRLTNHATEVPSSSIPIIEGGTVYPEGGSLVICGTLEVQ